MPNLVVADFTGAPVINKNCGWAIALNCKNADGTAFDLTPFSSFTFQVRAKPDFSSATLATGAVTTVSLEGGVLTLGLAAKDTGTFTATGDTFQATSPVWGELDGILTADPLNPICLAHGVLQVAPGGNAEQSSGTAPTVPLQAMDIVVGGVSAAAARALIGLSAMPSTAPTEAQIMIGAAGGGSYASVSMSGGATIDKDGVVTLAPATVGTPGAAPRWPPTTGGAGDIVVDLPASGVVPAFVANAATIAPGTDKASRYPIEAARTLAAGAALTLSTADTPVIGNKLIACYALALGQTLSIVNGGPLANTLGTFEASLTKPRGLVVYWDGTNYRFNGYVELTP